jgi:hypothetical protein
MQCRFTVVDLPSTLTEIGYAAFAMCQSLKEITIPESVTTLSDSAFIYCTSLEKAVVKANITDLKSGVFYNSVVTQGTNVFTNTALTEVYLSSTIQKVALSALSGNMLSDIYYGGTEEEWKSLYFYEYVQNETSGEYEENVLEKSEVVDGVAIHYNVEF